MSDIVLLDGGMGQELIHRSQQPPSPLWSAKVMMDEPELVRAVHEEYIAAGAKVMTLNAYSATPERLARDASEDLFKPLQAKAIEIAQAARGVHDVRIAGCLSPLFGSYHPEFAPEFDICLETYRRVVAEQKDHVDLFLCETLSSIKEVKAAVQAAAESGKPVWSAMSVKDEEGTKLRSGESLAEAAVVAKQAGASAVLINCSWPEAVTQGQAALANTGLPYGGYANGFTQADDLQIGTTVSGLLARTDLDPVAYANHAMSWIEAGATIVGGCCEVGPAHIAELARRLKAAGHRIVSSLPRSNETV
jgi:homocysteine S-methyltransferase